MFYFCASSGKSKFRYSNEQHGHDRLFFFFMKPIFHGFCIRCTLFFFCNFHFGFFFLCEWGKKNYFYIVYYPEKHCRHAHATHSGLFYIWDCHKKPHFFFRASLAQNAKYFRRKGFGLLLLGSSHLQRGCFNPQSQLFGQMNFFFFFFSLNV